MPQNVEVKVRISNWDMTLQKCQHLSNSPGETLTQRDVFFSATHGRLKLRDFQNGHGQLIYYSRPDVQGPKLSDYSISSTTDPVGLAQVLAQALSVRGIVVKKRLLFLVGQTRIHLDRVDDLGDFLELEVVLTDTQTQQDGDAIAQHLMGLLGIQQDNLVTGAYIDLLHSADKDE